MRKSLIVSLIIVFVLVVFIGYVKTFLETDKAAVNQLDVINSDLIKKDSEYKLVFFGYAGCYHFCDPRLRQIDPIYKELKKHLDLKVLFIDISQEATHEASGLFVKDVNSEFEAINPNNDGIKNLQKKFQDVYVRKMPDGEYMHSGFLYLLKKYKQKYYLLEIYPEFVNSDAIIADIKNISAQ